MHCVTLVKTAIGALVGLAAACGVILVGIAMRQTMPLGYDWVRSQWLDISASSATNLFHDFGVGYMVIFGLAVVFGVTWTLLGGFRVLGELLCKSVPSSSK